MGVGGREAKGVGGREAKGVDENGERRVDESGWASAVWASVALNGWLPKRWVQLTSDNASEKFRQPKVQLTSDTSSDF